MKRPLPALILAPPVFVITAAALYLTIVLAEQGMNYLVGKQVEEIDIPFHRLELGFLAITSLVYGIMRLARYHPAFQLPYGKWLLATPWMYKQPLPLGPIHLNWRDVLFLAPLVLLNQFRLHEDGTLPLITFLYGYLAISVLTLLITKPNWAMLGIGAILPLGFITGSMPWVHLASLCVACAIAAVGIQVSLRHFPWHIGMQRPQPDAAGWPFARLGTDEKPKAIRAHIGILLSLFAGWIAFCLTFLNIASGTETADLNLPASFLFPTGCLIVAIVRWLIYAFSHRPPISIFGRLATGHLIIPGHDQIYLAPLAVLATSPVAICLLSLRIYPPVAFGIAATAALLPALTFGPSLYRWHLVGINRISRSSSRNRRAGASDENVSTMLDDAFARIQSN